MILRGTVIIMLLTASETPLFMSLSLGWGNDMKNRDTGKQRLDMLHGSLWDKIPRFALPIAATAILGQLFNAADIAVVGNFAGDVRTQSVAAVGANGAIIGLIVQLFIGAALGANVVIAHAIGEENPAAVQKAVHTSIVVALIGGIAAALLGQLVAAPLLGALNVPEDVLPLALLYLRIYLAGLPVILLYNFEAAIFRSIGETKTPLVVLTASGILNVILNLFFVIVLQMAVAGVAVATVISNAVSSVLLYWRLRTTKQVIHVDPALLRVDGEILKRILRIGLPAGIQSAVFSVSNIIIQSAVNSLGTVVMAATSASFNIEVITYNILSSFSQACTTFVGQNFGAGQIRRCKRTLLLCIAEGVVILAVVVPLVLFWGKTLLSVFSDDPAVVACGYIRLSALIPAHLFSLMYEVMSGYMRGFGISLTPAALTTAGVCGIRVAWIHWVFPLHKSFQTIVTVYPLSLGTTALLIFIALLCCCPSRRYASVEAEGSFD